MWKPIETAPQDRRFLACAELLCDEFDEEHNLIAKNKLERYAVVACFAFGSIVEYPWRGSCPTNLKFTHWQELPALPSRNAS